MNTAYKKIDQLVPTNSLVALVFSLALLSLAMRIESANADPYLAFKTGNTCSACHVNPIGGGARNSYGAYYGSQVLPANKGEASAFDLGKISDSILFGGDLRFNLDKRDSDSEDGDSQSFNTQSGQIYLSVQPKNSRFSFYLDQQVSPGAAVSREAFVLAKLKGRHYLKLGKIMLPYGIRLEDDSAFIRQASQINFDNSDNGVELGLEYAHLVVNFALSNGTSSSGNDDENFQYTSRIETFHPNWRLGASAVLNDSEAGDRTMYNVFAGANWLGFTFLAELDRIEDSSSVNAFGSSTLQTAGLFEVNKELGPGINLKLTEEFLDPDDDIEHHIELEVTRLAGHSDGTVTANDLG